MTSRARSTALRTLVIAALCAGIASALSGCSGSAGAQTADAQTAGTPGTLRLGYFDDVTHAPALIGVHEGIFAKALGPTKLTTQRFQAGPAELEALNAGAIDAAFVGPTPAINSFVSSGGRSLRIVAGATNGGAALVVRDGIDTAAQLRGKTLATPQLGNTQDVALRTFLTANGLRSSLTSGGEVNITPMSNAQTLQQFEQGKLDGAWVPEPWVSRLVVEGHGHVLVDESTQWPGGSYPTTVLVVSANYLKANPRIVAKLVAGENDAVGWLHSHSAEQIAAAAGAQLVADGGSTLPDGILTRSLEDVTFSVDPAAADFPAELAHSKAAGISQGGELHGIFVLGPLNSVLAKNREQPVSAAGLGTQ